MKLSRASITVGVLCNCVDGRIVGPSLRIRNSSESWSKDHVVRQKNALSEGEEIYDRDMLDSLGTSTTIESNGKRQLEGVNSVLKWEHAKDSDADWRQESISKLWALREKENNFDTPLLNVTVPYDDKIQIYFKDETQTETENLKHRFAWMLFLWAVMEGFVRSTTHVYECSSGNTATSEAYFADKLGIKYTTVVAAGTSTAKQQRIKNLNGNVIESSLGIYNCDLALNISSSDETAFFMNQFKNSASAIDYFASLPYNDFGASNVAASFMRQLDREPKFVVHSSGTGGTATSIGKYIFRHGLKTQVVLADPEGSTITAYVSKGIYEPAAPTQRYIEGVGTRINIQYRENYGLNRNLLFQVICVQGQASVAAMEMMKNITGVAPGPSSGLNFMGAMTVAQDMHKRGESGSIVTIICDGKSNYENNYYNHTWLENHNFTNMDSWRKYVSALWTKGSS